MAKEFPPIVRKIAGVGFVILLGVKAVTYFSTDPAVEACEKMNSKEFLGNAGINYDKMSAEDKKAGMDQCLDTYRTMNATVPRG